MAGAGFKTFNTGDVLLASEVNTYLMQQTVMVFADAAARTTALTGVVSEGMISYLKDTNAVEVYNGSAWVASDDPNAIQNTIVDAKGDLIAASANDTPARLAVGNNGETLVADSSQTTGLRYNPPVGSLANPVINGGFDIWQRGTSISFANLKPYAADRWQGVSPSGSTNATFSRQTVNDSTNLPNIQYAARLQRAASNTITSPIAATQSIETANSIPLAGKAITLSFYARRGANFSGASNELSVYLYTGTGTDQNINGTWTGLSTIINNQKAALTTTWQRFAFTANVASTATEMGMEFTYTPSGTAGADDWFEITGVQVDVGTWTASTAPTFRRSGGTLAGELAACQRYYEVLASGTNSLINLGTAYNNNNWYSVVRSKQTMRTSPTLVSTTGTDYYNVTGNNGNDLFNALAGTFLSKPDSIIIYADTGLVTTIGLGYWVFTNNASASVALSAEL